MSIFQRLNALIALTQPNKSCIYLQNAKQKEIIKKEISP